MRTSEPDVIGTCDGGDCDRLAVTAAYCERIGGLISVCRRHLTTYRVLDGKYWQVEDEAYDLRFCRRSRSKTLAQWKLLLDQRAAMRGRVSLAQRIKTWRANR